ncbi:hypothetical protein [Arthrobacter sp. MW3 TE3886]|uniref:hypothetical protein n=1 Tax=Arthrobacter sp. MW3 TE3886 TaxID=3156254 RepID=UPI0035164673
MGAPSDSIPFLDLSTARGRDGTFDPAFIDVVRDATHRARSRGVSDNPDNPMLAPYGANVLKGWLRAHPEVARSSPRTYPDRWAVLSGRN